MYAYNSLTTIFNARVMKNEICELSNFASPNIYFNQNSLCRLVAYELFTSTRQAGKSESAAGIKNRQDAEPEKITTKCSKYDVLRH